MNITNQKIISEILESEELDIKELICDPTLILEDMHILKSESSSTTIQMFAKIKEQSPYLILLEFMKRHNNKVFVKISFEDPTDNSGLIERTMYKYLLHLYFEKRTPNIMRYVASFKCDGFATYIEQEFTRVTDPIKKNLLGELIDKTNRLSHVPGINVEKATFLVVERGIGMDLDHLLESHTINEAEFIEIMFQLFYTLREMYIHKVRHNDLHLGNIWINVHSRPHRLIYFVNDDDYVILKTKYIVKIYDFDHSAFTIGPLENTLVDNVLCPIDGECSNDNPYFDPHTIAYILYHGFLDDSSLEYVREFAKEVIRDDYYLSENCCQPPGRMCQLTNTPFGLRCLKDFVPIKGEIYTFTDLYHKTHVFDNLKKSLSQDGYKQKDIPIDKVLPIDANPWLEFKKHVYVSSVCTKSAMELADYLYINYGKGLSGLPAA